MRSTLAIAAFAVGALAIPYQQGQEQKKRDNVVVWDYVTSWDYVTVTAGDQPAAETSSETETTAPAPKHYGHHSHSHAANSPAGYTTTTNTPSAAPAYSAPETQAPKSSTEAPAYSAPPSSTSKQSSAPSYTDGTAPTDYSGKCIYHHNLHRANHSCADIVWDDGLASIAETIAQSCVYAHNTEAGGGGYGQNIAAGVAAENISAIITDLFYNAEAPYFAQQYGKAQPDMANFELFGHFTQVVWKGSTHVGCATVECPNGLANTGSGVEPIFTVCNYKGPGNYANEYADNVLRPLGYPTANWNTGGS